MGELEHKRGRDFAALRAEGPVLVVTTSGRDAPYARLAVSTFDPESDAALLRQANAKPSKS
ncbi:hypothetical protein [Streptomyces sp. Ru71]|uniref:hypothetical protein n=1 Tax=Streptomyces sp. Ru71 TaxID=2080746 RepID=UPI002156408C|nr:hypothetical protein [Streptomyces sp. Ru71]